MNNPVVAHLVYDLIRGGTEGQCARIALGLARRGWTQHMTAFYRRGFFLEEVEASCGPVYELDIRHMVHPSTFRAIRDYARWLRHNNVDILHAWDADAAIFGQRAAAWAGIQFITSRRDMGEIYPWYKQRLMAAADRRAVRVVANAEVIRNKHIHQGLPADKCVLLPNLLDVDERDRLSRQPFPQASQLPVGRRAVVVNRLDPEKNTGALIRALALVRQQKPDAVLIVAGDGPQMPLLRNEAARLNIQDSICFLGDTPDIPSLLPLCEIGLLVPTANEGLSNTILEYMAASLPVLATDCGGNAELVKDGQTGRLVAVHATPDEIAQAWLDMLCRPSVCREWGAAGHRMVEQRFHPDVVLPQFEKLYAAVAAQSLSPRPGIMQDE